jgi:hypothetical protein
MFSGSCASAMLNSTNVRADVMGGDEACVESGSAARTPIVTAIPRASPIGMRKRLICNLSSSRLAVGAQAHPHLRIYIAIYE